MFKLKHFVVSEKPIITWDSEAFLKGWEGVMFTTLGRPTTVNFKVEYFPDLAPQQLG